MTFFRQFSEISLSCVLCWTFVFCSARFLTLPKMKKELSDFVSICELEDGILVLCSVAGRIMWILLSPNFFMLTPPI